MDIIHLFYFSAGKRRDLWPWPRPGAHLPAGMTEGGGIVKQSQLDYEYSEIFLMLPREPRMAELRA